MTKKTNNRQFIIEHVFNAEHTLPQPTPPDEINIAGFGQRLRLLRQHYGLSQSALGQLVGYSASQINRIEKGSRRVSLFVVQTVFEPVLARYKG